MRLTARQSQAVDRLKGLDPDVQFFWDEQMTVPEFVKGKLSEESTDDPESIARR